jgi:hypothetical protein
MKRILTFDPQARITAAEALDDPFFDSVKKENSQVCIHKLQGCLPVIFYI